MTGNTFHRWSMLQALTVCLSAMLSLPAFANQPAPVWTLNFKDTFLDIACVDKHKAIIVGDRGRLLVTHGTYNNLWAPRDSKTKEMLTSISFIDDKHGWAAGHGGIIIHTNDGGQNWEVQREPSAENLPLFDIQFPSVEVGYASGAYDTLMKTTDGGKTWNLLPTGIDNIYNGLFFHDADNGFLVGEFGTLLKTSDGAHSWQKIDIGGYQGSLFGITFLSRETAVAYGINGKLIISYDGGDSWADIPTGTEEVLYRAAAIGSDVAVVGRSGVTLLSNDGAKSFTKKSEPDNYSLAGVCAHSAGFVAVGEFGTILNIETLPTEQPNELPHE